MFRNKISTLSNTISILKKEKYINSTSSQNIPLYCFDTKIMLTRSKNVTVGNKHTAKVARRMSATYKREKISDEAEMAIEAEIIICMYRNDVYSSCIFVYIRFVNIVHIM